MSTTPRFQGRVDDPPPPARLQLAPGRPGTGMLDGAWWPRSRDPITELASLIDALGVAVGQVFRIGLNHVSWDARPPRVVADGRVVKVGWYGPSDIHAVSVTGAFSPHLDLLVVPPTASPASAQTAMAQACDPASRMRAAQILTGHGIVTAGATPADRPLTVQPRTAPLTLPAPVGPDVQPHVVNGASWQPGTGA